MTHRFHAAVAALGFAIAPPATAQDAVDDLKPAFQAVVSFEETAKVQEKSLAKALKRRAKALGFSIRIERGAFDDARLAISLDAENEATARKQLELLVNRPDIELRKIHSENDELVPKIQKGANPPPGWKLYEYRSADDDGKTTVDWLLLSKEAAVRAKHFKSAGPDAARAGVLNVELTEEGGKRMKNLTGGMTKGLDRIAIVVNGEVRRAPVVQETLETQFIIQGIDDFQELKTLAALLTNSLGEDLEIESFRAAP